MGPWEEAFRNVKEAFRNVTEVVWDETVKGAKVAGQWLKAADAWWDRHPTVVLRLVVVILIWSQIMWGWRVDALEKQLARARIVNADKVDAVDNRVTELWRDLNSQGRDLFDLQKFTHANVTPKMPDVEHRR